MRTLTFSSLLLIIFFTSCNRTEDLVVDPVIEVPEIEEELELIESPFDQFLGSWTRELTLINGEVKENSKQSLFIEDENRLDSIATGYFAYENNPDKELLSFEYTDVESQILIKVIDSSSNVSYICLYNFLDDDQFELDDSDQWSTVVTLYKRD